jgi:hypothetical protein
MIGCGLCTEVVRYVEDWIPERSYRSESKFQNDLQDYLDYRVNESGGVGLGLRGSKQVPVKREHGSVNADVAVGEEVGIEIKRNFTNSKKHRLSGQITDYRKEYSCVVVVACGITDMDGWRELQNEYGGAAGFGMNQGDVHFVHKRKDHFGKDPSDVRQDSGLFGGEGLF